MRPDKQPEKLILDTSTGRAEDWLISLDENNGHPSYSNAGGEARVSVSFFVCLAVVAALYLAREILIPFSLAILVSFCLAPAVLRIERLRVPRVIAVSLVCLTAFTLVGMLGWIMSKQFVELTAQLPQYRTTIMEKADFLQWQVGNAVSKAARTAKVLDTPLGDGATADKLALDQSFSNRNTPIPVEIVQDRFDPVDLIGTTLGSLLHPLLTTGLVIVFTIFILINREDLRNRFIRLVAHGELIRTTKALEETTRRVSKYLLSHLMLNMIHGVLVTIGLHFLGLPNALFWGILAGIMRFIPYIGPWVTSLLPIALSFAIFDNWTQPLAVIGFLVALELVSNNILEPWFYANGTGLSPIAVLIAALFWTWLWGAVGLVMSVPLTVCLVVMGRHVHQGKFLYILLGDQPMLSPSDRLYQRLLSMDPQEAQTIINDYLKEKPRVELFDSVIIPALVLCERDRRRGVLDRALYSYVVQMSRDLIEDLADPQEVPGEPQAREDRLVISLPLTEDTEEVAALMVAKHMEHAGYRVELLSNQLLVSEMVAYIEEHYPIALCLAMLPPFAFTRLRYVLKRLHARFPELKIIVGLWSAPFDVQLTKKRLEAAGVSGVVTEIGDVLALLPAVPARREVSTG